MFNFFKKEPAKKLQKLYDKKLVDAMEAQRNGNIALFAQLSSEADQLLKKLDEELELTKEK